MAKQVSEAPGRIAYLTIHSIVGGYAMQVVGIHYEVSERAVLRGVNRALAHQGYRVLKTVPGTRAEFDLGVYFEVDTQYNGCTCAKLVDSLDEEQRRAAEEGLDEDELALFDLLKKDKLGKAERDKVKQAS